MATKTNQFGQTYSGNDDFRGWLAAGGVKSAADVGLYGVGPLTSTGLSSLLLQNVGNDGRSGNAKYDQAAQKAYSMWQTGRTASAQTNNSYLQGLQSQLAALQRQLAYQPKLPTFDVLGNFKQARSQAEAAVNPLYEKYLKDFLAKQATLTTNKQTETNLRREGTALELQQALAQSAVDRTRTAEDTATAVQQLNEQEGNFQQDSGTQFDIDRRAAAEEIAASGLTMSGIGQNKMFEQARDRNITEERQVKEFNNQRAAKQLYQTRTFEDLARGDKNSQALATQKDKEAQFDLDSYLAELANDETSFRTQNELDRLSSISTQADTFERQGTQSFLASLAGAGWRPQDIALAYQIYG